MYYSLLGIGVLVLLGIFFFATQAPRERQTSTEKHVPVLDIETERTIQDSGGTLHSIPLDEILSGGPGKDGIPSIDEPVFESARASRFLDDADPGIGLFVGGEARFYPYRILVWHEIVNDTIQGKPVLVTYCPLCATGIVFDRTVDGRAEEFGVSGRLWQSNLLMYNRASSAADESLWSQVLGEAVVGAHTGKTLAVIPSDIMRWGEWKRVYPETLVLTTKTGASRDYARDPYGDYYSSESILFGSQFRDERLHPKALVHGIRVGETYKAYPITALPEGTFIDTVDGRTVTVSNVGGVIRFALEGESLSSIPSFWFSWLAVHPETELYE